MPVDLDFLRSMYDVHNSAGADFPDLFARDYLHPDVEFVETPTAPGATTHRGSDAVATLFRDRFEVGGAEASMRLWNLLTLDGSRITRVEEFSDEPAALAAAGPRFSPDS
jgi:ketosteroid isomerase-like protein